VEDLAIGALSQALSGLSVRQSYIAADTANIETPGYLAHNVDFESDLRGAIDDGNPYSADSSSPTVTSSTEPTRTNGNNVNLDEETLNGEETGLRYQLATQAINNEFSRLKSAMGAA
jgi:flagellar basal-body rod protein FlgB